MKMQETGQIYGPVPSRRLGFSLGIDPVPFKTCSLDCIYCQLGRTTNKTAERKEYVPAAKIISQLEEVLSLSRKIDYITFSGSGEPSLNSEIGSLIKKVKKISPTPVAVLTNGSLLFRKDLREDLLNADLVIPSLDAATQEMFERVNRPHPSLKIDKIIDGMREFRKEFEGKIWLEIMLIKGINDGVNHIEKLKETVSELSPDKVQLNTVIRPPSEEFARALNLKELERIRDIIEGNSEIIAQFEQKEQKAYEEDVESAIVALLKRRPVTLADISNSLGIHRNELIKRLEALEKNGEIKSKVYGGLRYYEAGV